MNKRRWVAVAIAIGLFVCSGVFALMAPPANEESSLDGLNALLYGSNELEEHQIAAGDSNNRILRLTLEGTIANTSGGGLFSTEGYDHQLFLEDYVPRKRTQRSKGFYLK